MDFEKITFEVIEACRNADEKIIDPLRKSLDFKLQDKDGSGRNLVTQADLQTEAYLKLTLGKLLPQAGFIAEESEASQAGQEYHWIIDPIDGTTNFIHGLPPFAISIALAKGHEIVVGVIYELFTKECFYAWQHGGAWCNQNPIVVSHTKQLNDALLCTGFPYDQGDEALFNQWIAIMVELLKITRGVRRLGAASVDMAYVAAGRLDAFYEYNLQPWDVAAGSLIVKEAGGNVTDFKGGKNHLFGGELLASNGKIHEGLLKLLGDLKH